MNKTPIQDEIIDRMLRIGYDGWTAISEASRIVREFKASGERVKRYGIMGSFGKCVDVIELRRR